MIRTRARGFDRDCPHGVVQGFQITSHKSEPVNSTRNLLSKDCWRASLGDKAKEDGPEVPVVGKAFLRARETEGLTGAGAGPDGTIFGPSGTRKRIGPSTDSGEHVNLRVPN